MKKFFLKIFGNKKPAAGFNFADVKSVLIRPVGTGIGDGIILTAVFKQLKQAYPDIKTGVFVLMLKIPRPFNTALYKCLLPKLILLLPICIFI